MALIGDLSRPVTDICKSTISCHRTAAMHQMHAMNAQQLWGLLKEFLCLSNSNSE